MHNGRLNSGLMGSCMPKILLELQRVPLLSYHWKVDAENQVSEFCKQIWEVMLLISGPIKFYSWLLFIRNWWREWLSRGPTVNRASVESLIERKAAFDPAEEVEKWFPARQPNNSSKEFRSWADRQHRRGIVNYFQGCIKEVGCVDWFL